MVTFYGLGIAAICWLCSAVAFHRARTDPEAQNRIVFWIVGPVVALCGVSAAVIALT